MIRKNYTYNIITENKSNTFKNDVLPNLYNPLLSDIFSREIFNKLNTVYLYQKNNGFDWLNLLYKSPEAFVVLFTKFEPPVKMINNVVYNNTLIFFMCYIYARDSQTFYTGTEYLRDVLERVNINTQAGANTFNENIVQLQKNIDNYVEKMLTLLNNIKKICVTLPAMQNVELTIIQRLFRENFIRIVPLSTIIKNLDVYNTLINSIYDIQELCGSFSESIDTTNGLNVLKIGWYTDNFFTNLVYYPNMNNPYNEIDRNNVYRRFNIVNERNVLGPLLITQNQQVYNLSNNQDYDTWEYISLFLKDKESMNNLYEWYDWASQFWLRKSYKAWFKTFHLMNRNIFDNVIMMYRTTDLLILDETTSGIYLFIYNLLTELNMPNLQNIIIMRLNNIWYLPPEKRLNIRTTADYMDTAGESFTSLHQKNNFLMGKLKENTLIGLNTMIYTEDMSLISRLIINDIDVNITSYNMEPYNILKLKKNILENRTICGPYTPKVRESTRLYTHLFILFLSRCSGIPLYSVFGLGNLLTVWNSMVKSSMESIVRKNVDETSPWLAREKSNNSIELNGIAITELIIRLLGKSFKFDNIKKNKGKMDGYSIYLKKAYDKMKDENIFGIKRCEPVVVDKLWLEKWNIQSQTDEIWNDMEDQRIPSREQYVAGRFNETNERHEWCIGQRLIFEKYFYYPNDIEEVLSIIKSRFKHWCVEDSTIIMSVVTN